MSTGVSGVLHSTLWSKVVDVKYKSPWREGGRGRRRGEGEEEEVEVEEVVVVVEEEEEEGRREGGGRKEC